MNCTFCGAALVKGRGKMYVKVSGQVLYYCGSKCEKNHALKRDGKKIAWTEKYADLKKK